MNDLLIELMAYIRLNHNDIYSTMFWAVIVLVLLIEVWRPRRRLNYGLKTRWFGNIVLGVVNNFLSHWLMTVVAVITVTYTAQNNWGLFNWIALPEPLVFLLSLALVDLLRYVVHRMYHNVPALWRLHRLHHTDLDLDYSTQFRFHPLETLTGAVFTLPVIALISPSVDAIIAHKLLFVVVAFFAHSNARLPVWLERYGRWIVTTPDLHKVHHSTAISESNANYGALFTCWDRMLGTYVDQPKVAPEIMEFGVTGMRDEKHLRLDWMIMNPFLSEHEDSNVIKALTSASAEVVKVNRE